MMLSKGWFLKAVLTAAAVAPGAGLWGCQDDEGGGIDGNLVGDWAPYSI